MTGDHTHDACRMALHACCGPCLLEPLDALIDEGFEPVVVFANPNIQPVEEYVLRRETLTTYAAARGIPTVELDTDGAAWRAATEGLDRPERCRACYAVRLGLVSRWAADHDIAFVTTTLTVSPYQDPDAIAAAGRAAAAAAGVTFVERDYRERYAEATRRSREAAMYRQNYCGCLASRTEAERERAQRRQERRRAREERD